MTKARILHKCAQFNFSRKRVMELECEKYKEKVDTANPVCNHPKDYCQFRTSCIIHFMEKENRRERERMETVGENKSKD